MMNFKFPLEQHVSVLELMNRYDRLIETMNDGNNNNAMNDDDNYHKLRYIGSILLQLPIKVLSQQQYSIIDRTVRRTYILQQILLLLYEQQQHDIRCHMNHINISHAIIPMHVTMTTSSDSSIKNQEITSSDNMKYQTVQWIDLSSSVHDDNNNTTTTDEIMNHSISITPDELIEEESMLIHMANTPIPTTTTVTNDTTTITTTMSNHITKHHDTTKEYIQKILCDEWGTEFVGLIK